MLKRTRPPVRRVGSDDSSRGAEGVTRRALLKKGTAALGGAAFLTGEASPSQNRAPAVQRGTNSGRPFRALVRHGTGIDVQELRLLPIQPRQVLVRTQAAAPCYTVVWGGALAVTPAQRVYVPNHCGFGVVEEIGPDVKRVQIGDRVVVAGTSQCGVCSQCLHGRADYCQFTFGGDDFPAFAEMQDKTPVFTEAGIGGLSELMAVYEEYCVPVFTDLPAAELCLLGDQLGSGFSAGHSLVRFEAGSDVVVFGAGPVGVGAIQAGRIASAGQVIAVEPVRYRREFALKMGATTVLDPLAEGDGIVERIRELCKGPTDRRFAGGNSYSKSFGSVMSRGADFVVEAAGVEVVPPKVERQPDPTNVKTVRQAWDCTRMGGHVMLMGLTLQEVPFPGVQLALLGRTIHPGQQGGLHIMRDIPRYVKLMEKGHLDAKSMITKTYGVSDMRQAVQDTADRTIITGVIQFS
jgi:S-(hydroxymethyl)glutathione dehydrogenase/alcohol dehydrogenase